MKMSRRNIIIVTSSSALLIIIFVSITIPLINYQKDPYEWEIGDPEDCGFDIAKLDLTYTIADNVEALRSVLVIRHGAIVAEWYFHGATMDTALHIHSASKSFISTLIGLAIHEGYIPNVETKMMDYFSEYDHLPLDPRMYNVTIKNLLTMEAGFDFNESTEAYIEYSESSNNVQYILEMSFMHDPGEYWHYCTLQSDLLSVILTKATGMSSMEFAQQYLYEPAHFTIDHWNQDSQGYYFGGHEMYYTPRAMARYGLMYLNNGTLFDQQIVQKEWVLESIHDHSIGLAVENWLGSGDGEDGYGYQWWLKKLDGMDTYSAQGLGGQTICCIPDLDMVVVTTATGSILDSASIIAYQQSRIFSIIGNLIQCVIE